MYNFHQLTKVFFYNTMLFDYQKGVQNEAI